MVKIERGDIMAMYGRSALIGWVPTICEPYDSRLGTEILTRFGDCRYANRAVLLLARHNGQKFVSLPASTSTRYPFEAQIFRRAVITLFELLMTDIAPANPTGFRIDIEIPDEIWNKCLPILSFLPDCVHIWKYEAQDQLKLIDIK